MYIHFNIRLRRRQKGRKGEKTHQPQQQPQQQQAGYVLCWTSRPRGGAEAAATPERADTVEKKGPTEGIVC